MQRKIDNKIMQVEGEIYLEAKPTSLVKRGSLFSNLFNYA